MNEVVGDLLGVVLASQAVDVLVCGVQYFVLDVLLQWLVLCLIQQFGGFFLASLYHFVEAVAARIEPISEEGNLLFVASLVEDRCHA